MKKIVLFDMDGTLTEPRKEMLRPMTTALLNLQKNGFEIGIVSGSDMDYIEEQCEELFRPIFFPYLEHVHFLPCNGTKYYRYLRGSRRTIYEKDMRKELGETNFRSLVKTIVNFQSRLCNTYSSLPLSGNFVSYRGSMINWCPIGRSATGSDRETWVLLDDRNRVRVPQMEALKAAFSDVNIEEIVVKLGGETSFDIYPYGWDKTFSFGVFKDYNEIYFVGDRCNPSGNDYEAYLLAGEGGYNTDGPATTKIIIDKIINSSKEKP